MLCGKRLVSELDIETDEWSEWDERHGRLRREGSGRAQRELPRYKQRRRRMEENEINQTPK